MLRRQSASSWAPRSRWASPSPRTKPPFSHAMSARAGHAHAATAGKQNKIPMPTHGKKYTEAAKKVEAEKLYAPAEAIALLREVSFTKFDPTIELHMQLGVDPRHADQMVRGTATLPAGTG